MKFYCIGDDDAVWGFRLAGVEGRVVKTPYDAREAFTVATATDKVGIILITERAANLIREEVDRYVYGESFPLVLEIPDAKGPLPGRKAISELIRKAVGIAV